jgi:hypothetical protein
LAVVVLDLQNEEVKRKREYFMGKGRMKKEKDKAKVKRVIVGNWGKTGKVMESFIRWGGGVFVRPKYRHLPIKKIVVMTVWA